MVEASARRFDVIAIGGGPAGLTAAVELARHGRSAIVLEASDQVGGISRTVVRGGWRFDLGGHRFFTKVARVEAFWREMLSGDDFLLRPRMSRIFYEGRFYDYPLRAMNALRNLGIWESIRCVASYVLVRLCPPKDQSHFEGWVAARFGWRLYRIFFKTYTEKVWGVPADEIGADWAAQRIRNLSLARAIAAALKPWARSSQHVTSLIESFHYPRLGPGMMWEACAERARGLGQEIALNKEVVRIRRRAGGNLSVFTHDGSEYEGTHVIASMPLGQLIATLDPAPSSRIIDTATDLRYRDFLTVALIVPREVAFPDNWIYIHAPGVRVGRIQNFGTWSPDMIKEDATCLGLEYFVNAGDDLWEREDDDLIRLATEELESLGLVPTRQVKEGYVVRVRKAYPVYDAGYAERVAVLREFLEHDWPSIHPVGRNGMHRYNNQDHSMLTAMITVDNIALGQQNDIWAVNVEQEYHESGPRRGLTGRDAPTMGRRDGS